MWWAKAGASHRFSLSLPSTLSRPMPGFHRARPRIWRSNFTKDDSHGLTSSSGSRLWEPWVRQKLDSRLSTCTHRCRQLCWCQGTHSRLWGCPGPATGRFWSSRLQQRLPALGPCVWVQTWCLELSLSGQSWFSCAISWSTEPGFAYFATTLDLLTILLSHSKWWLAYHSHKKPEYHSAQTLDPPKQRATLRPCDPVDRQPVSACTPIWSSHHWRPHRP